MLQLLESPAFAVPCNEFNGKILNYLLSIFGSLVMQYILLDTHAYMPIHPASL